MLNYQDLLDQMTLEEKVALCSGADYFTTKSYEKPGIPSIRMVDGPHGIRVQIEAADHLGVHKSLPATCFPTACLAACSWDRELLREMGAAIGEEALQAGVSIVLGPGANIKRNPLCGRNFEYFSEDPFLAGEMASGWIEGIQSVGVGASLKHFAGNNQENERMASDSLIDERTLREIYLPAFEKAVKSARPASVMCAYNKLNGIFCSDHSGLLRDILRGEWRFEGVLLTDWGAMNDRLKAFTAGMDLEMPGSMGYFDQAVITAIQTGGLPEALVDESVDRLLKLIFTADVNRKQGISYDSQAHHQLARKIAANSAVLLKNDGHLLPIHQGQKIALIGALASEPRYQGAGSSMVNPLRLCSALDGFQEWALDYNYFLGYPLTGIGNAALLKEAVAGARASDIAVVFAGLPAEFESEGFDRASLAMPDSHTELIEKVADANPNTVVVLAGGSPVEMPWLPRVKAVLHLYLAGQAGGLAAVDLLMGKVNPAGKLAESYPLSYADVPSAGFYEAGGKQAQYREGLYVGYRYYDSAGKDVLFPFGHGLSYTTFEYTNLTLSTAAVQPPDTVSLNLTIQNTGSQDGAEIVQVYVSQAGPSVFRPQKELKEFTRVFVKAGEAKQVTFTLNARSFAVYDTGVGDWVVPGGTYRILVGASSRDIRQQAELTVLGEPARIETQPVPDWYQHPAGAVTQEDFEALLGRKIEPVKKPRRGEYTLDCSFDDMKDRFIVRLIIKVIEMTIGRSLGGVDKRNPTYKMLVASARSTPLKNISLVSPESMPRHVTEGIVCLANGKYWPGIKAILRI